MQKAGKEYDTAQRGRAWTGLALRVLVAGYLGYLVWKIVSGMRAGASPIPVWAFWLITAVFAVVAAGFCVYAVRTFLKALKAAEIKPVLPAESGEADAGDASGPKGP
jgi:TRAP-type C4-dicarboxylate transport system permease small subunit